MITPIQISHYTAVSALGYGLEAHRQALMTEQGALASCNYKNAKVNTFIGRVPQLEAQAWPNLWKDYFSRNNLLALTALHQDDFLTAISNAKDRYGAKRVGLLLGTTTSGFSEAERAYRQRDKQGNLPNDFDYRKTAHPYATGEFLRNYLALQGPAMTIATACSSSAKAFICAQRWLQLNLCDAVLIAGIDSLCLNILYGFHSLGILSTEKCCPFAQNRSGLSLGEAAALVLVERANTGKIGLLGFGESTDGYHMSAPHPEGKGAILAMQAALNSAKLAPSQIDYINFHGTASLQNDRIEDQAVYQLFKNEVPASSTKGWMGHTLGAAGALEVIIACLAIEQKMLWATLNTIEIDQSLRSYILLKNTAAVVKKALVNSFGFGGNNCSLIIGEISDE